MDLVERENRFIAKHPLPEVTKEGDVYTIKLSVKSYNFFEIMRKTHPDSCGCYCWGCIRGLHGQCQSDGQSCYFDGDRRVDDGVWNRKPAVLNAKSTDEEEKAFFVQVGLYK